VDAGLQSLEILESYHVSELSRFNRDLREHSRDMDELLLTEAATEAVFPEVLPVSRETFACHG